MIVQKGMLFKSNDPRDLHRGTYQVDAVLDGKAVLVRSAGDWTRVALKHLHLDDKPRRSGWRLISPMSDKPVWVALFDEAGVELTKRTPVSAIDLLNGTTVITHTAERGRAVEAKGFDAPVGGNMLFTASLPQPMYPGDSFLFGFNLSDH